MRTTVARAPTRMSEFRKTSRCSDLLHSTLQSALHSRSYILGVGMALRLTLFLAASSLLLTFVVYRKINFMVRERRFRRNHGCKKLRRSPQKDPFLGLDLFVHLAKAARCRQHLQAFTEWFERVGSTFGVNLMGDDMIFTNEPNNIQALLVTHFSDFEIGERRRAISAQMLGVGIFNADGKTWEHGRALIRPHFTRKQVADLRIFEKHVNLLMKAIPEDGSPVDIQELVFRFVSFSVQCVQFYVDSLPDSRRRHRVLAWRVEQHPSARCNRPCQDFSMGVRYQPRWHRATYTSRQVWLLL